MCVYVGKRARLPTTSFSWCWRAICHLVGNQTDSIRCIFARLFLPERIKLKPISIRNSSTVSCSLHLTATKCTWAMMMALDLSFVVRMDAQTKSASGRESKWKHLVSYANSIITKKCYFYFPVNKQYPEVYKREISIGPTPPQFESINFNLSYFGSISIILHQSVSRCVTFNHINQFAVNLIILTAQEKQQIKILYGDSMSDWRQSG